MYDSLTRWPVARQAAKSFNYLRSFLKLLSIEWVTLSNYLTERGPVEEGMANHASILAELFEVHGLFY